MANSIDTCEFKEKRIQGQGDNQGLGEFIPAKKMGRPKLEKQKEKITLFINPKTLEDLDKVCKIYGEKLGCEITRAMGINMALTNFLKKPEQDLISNNKN
ncbi:hypothetical protein [Helicobacter sp. 11S02629-2]|uniref:hypothetical protein n=1 Tax=Helicobacter sp. 11S02629-2 TaxID=1476195 RepID=UPI000BA6B6C7|nr:hypothetical protein [Helicobacter sp. 11S02629-2]PAF41388.1 hypothetical protein BKH40_08420 [Helicobacter sp. 11S02629-2]